METLRGTQLFAPLSEGELNAIAERTALKSYSPGELVFSEGDACKGLFVVASGRVRIFKISRNGREQVLAIEGPGRPVAELPVFDGGSYPASSVAVESSELLFLSRADIRAVCLEHPEVSLKLLQVIGTRLRRLVGIIEELSFTSLRQRLISWLLKRAKEEGKIGPQGAVVFQTGVTHQEIAAQIGTVRELVSRNMARLQAQSLVQVNGQEITIPDQAALEAELTADI
jgi:CRP/FNR family transcriptional regulator, cyclic AMP receptor protein